jgi:hypothetical protein
MRTSARFPTCSAPDARLVGLSRQSRNCLRRNRTHSRDPPPRYPTTARSGRSRRLESSRLAERASVARLAWLNGLRGDLELAWWYVRGKDRGALVESFEFDRFTPKRSIRSVVELEPLTSVRSVDVAIADRFLHSLLPVSPDECTPQDRQKDVRLVLLIPTMVAGLHLHRDFLD